MIENAPEAAALRAKLARVTDPEAQWQDMVDPEDPWAKQSKLLGPPTTHDLHFPPDAPLPELPVQITERDPHSLTLANPSRPYVDDLRGDLWYVSTKGRTKYPEDESTITGKESMEGASWNQSKNMRACAEEKRREFEAQHGPLHGNSGDRLPEERIQLLILYGHTESGSLIRDIVQAFPPEP